MGAKTRSAKAIASEKFSQLGKSFLYFTEMLHGEHKNRCAEYVEGGRLRNIPQMVTGNVVSGRTLL